MPKIKNNAGFTLVELVITIGLMVIILLVLLILYDNYYKTYNSQQAIVRIAGSASAIANEIQNSALQADSIATSTIISGTTYTTGTSTVVFELPSSDSTGSNISSKYDYIVFYLNNNKLYKKLQPNASSTRSTIFKQLSDSVNSITYTYNNNNVSDATKLDVDIQTQVITSHQTFPYNLHQTIYLRNK